MNDMSLVDTMDNLGVPNLREVMGAIVSRQRRIDALPDGRACDHPQCLEGYCLECGRYKGVRLFSVENEWPTDKELENGL